MKRLFIYSLLALLATTYACKKDKQTDPEQPDVINSTGAADYSKLKVGNYWIYQNFWVNGSNSGYSGLDSCYIEKDTTIKGTVYFKMMKPFVHGNQQMVIDFLRDSADCIVNSKGDIMFSLSNFSTPLYISYVTDPPTGDTLFKLVRKMTDKDLVVTVPAGTYTTVNAQHIAYLYPPYGPLNDTRIKHLRYAKDVGVVYETITYASSSANYIERKLLRYHLN